MASKTKEKPNELVQLSETMNLHEVIDKKLFEYILGLVSSYVGCASLGVTKDGEVTNEINYSHFCKNVVRNTEKGLKACQECDRVHCEKAIAAGKSEVYKCHLGLSTSAVPIFDGRENIGAIMCGQVVLGDLDIEFYKQKAKELGIDEKTYLDGIKSIPVVDEERFKEAIKQVEKFSQTISNLAAAKRLEQVHQHKEDFVMTLLSAINDKKDLRETILSLIGKAAELFEVDRILIMDFFNGKPCVEIDYFAPDRVDAETIKAFHKAEENQWVLNAWQNEFLNKGLILVDDINSCSLEPELRDLYKDLGFKSGLSAMIKTEGEAKVLILEKFDQYHTWSNKEKSFLNLIAKEITAALIQAQMTKDNEHQLYIQETLLNNIPFELWMKDIEGKYITVNDMWLKNNHKKMDDVIGKTDADLFPPEIAAKFQSMDAQVLKTKEPIQEELEEQRGNSVHWKRKYACPILDNQNEIVGFAGYKSDITDRKEVDKLKSEFISTVSHELRTPLTSIISGLRLTLSGALGEIPQKAHTALDVSARNSQRLLSLINDILDIEKLSAGKMEYSYELVNVSEVVEETAKEILDFANKYNVVVTYKPCTGDEELYLNVDKSRFIQILTNLLSNAIKFTEDEKDVEIFVTDLPTDRIRVSVVNYGPVVPEEYREKIYGRFVQVDSSISREKNGTGLGLSITLQLVKDMNGTIDFVSRNGKTVFFVEFDKVI